MFSIYFFPSVSHCDEQRPHPRDLRDLPRGDHLQPKQGQLQGPYRRERPYSERA